MGSQDKLDLRIGGMTLLDRALAAVEDAAEVVVVGPERTVERDVIWVCEQPPGGGPLAGLCAGLTAVGATCEFVLVLAADHPFLTKDTVTRLLSTVDYSAACTGAVLADPQGRQQWLVGAWRTEPLRRGMPSEVQGKPVRVTLAALGPALVQARGNEASDVDIPADVRKLGLDQPSIPFE